MLLDMSVSKSPPRETTLTRRAGAQAGPPRSPEHPLWRYRRSDLKLARISSTNNSGCSHAAKWVPRGNLL